MEGSPYVKPSRVKIVEEHGRAYLVVSRKKAKTITTHTSKQKTLSGSLFSKTIPRTPGSTRPPTHQPTNGSSTRSSCSSRNSPIVCEYNRHLEAENKQLRKQNRMLHEYLQMVEKPSDTAVCQQYREMKRKFFDHPTHTEYYDKAGFIDTRASTYH